MALMGLTSFLPMFVQGVMGRSPVTAGLTLTVMLVGWPAGATLAARSNPRLGLKRVLVAGAALIPAGAVAFVLLGRGSSPYLAGAGSLVMGFGMGLASIAFLVIVQDSVGWADRGSATASNMFARNPGSALGATMLGAVLALGLHGQAGGAAVTPATLQRMFATGSHPGALAAHALSTALEHPLHLTFYAMLAIALATLAAAALVPSGVDAATPAPPMR